MCQVPFDAFQCWRLDFERGRAHFVLNFKVELLSIDLVVWYSVIAPVALVELDIGHIKKSFIYGFKIGKLNH